MVGAQGAAQVMKALKKPFSASAISLTPSSQGGVPTGMATNAMQVHPLFRLQSRLSTSIRVKVGYEFLGRSISSGLIFFETLKVHLQITISFVSIKGKHEIGLVAIPHTLYPSSRT